MGFRFRRSVRLLPGIRLNFGTRGVSTSVGGRGFTLNFGKRGIRSTVGIPGTGISYSEMLTRNGSGDGSRPAAPVGSSFGWGTLLCVIVVVVVLTRIVGGPREYESSGTLATNQGVAPSATPEPTAVVTAKVLKCRALPNTGGAVVSRLPHGTAVQELERRRDWVRVTEHAAEPSAESCWVAERFLRPA